MKKQDHIIARHDEVMPLMETYVRQRGALRRLTKDKASEARSKAEEAIQLTRRADEAMMDWMEQYTRVEFLKDSLNADEMSAYLVEQAVLIDDVAVQMLYADSVMNATIAWIKSQDQN